MGGKTMIYYIIKGHIFTLFLSMAHLTSVNFNSKITDYVGGQEGDFKIYELNKGRSLVFEPKQKGFSRNFITFMKRGKYHFNLSYNEEYSNKDIVIRQAKTCSYFTLLKETKSYQLFECPKSLFFINKLKGSVKINEFTVIDKSYLSKGPPIYLGKKLIYYQGRAL
jgi:hypothetical protein